MTFPIRVARPQAEITGLSVLGTASACHIVYAKLDQPAGVNDEGAKMQAGRGWAGARSVREDVDRKNE